MTEIQLNMYHALALGAAMYALGLVLTKKIPVFSRFCICLLYTSPSPRD